MAHKHRHITPPEAYRRYLDGLMSARERHEFEKTMLNDDFESEALEGLADLNKSRFKKDLSALQSELRTKTSTDTVWKYWRLAAVFLLLAAFSFSVYYLIDSGAPTEISQSKKTPTNNSAKNPDEQTAQGDSATKGYGEELALQQQPAANEREPIEKTKPNLPALAPATPAPIISETMDEEVFTDQNLKRDLEKPEIFEEEAEASEATIAEDIFIKGVPTAEMARKKKSMPGSAASMARTSTTRTISGKVTSSEDDEALPGVIVMVKGTQVGTVTDVNGLFEISVPTDTASLLQFSSVGYVREEIQAENQSEVNATLQPDITALNEIVVIGYGTLYKHDVSGSISTVEDVPEAYSYMPPSPEDGAAAYKEYIKNNIRYPASGRPDGIKGVVKLKFKVRPDGSIEDLRVVRSLGKDFDQEAIRLIKEGPRWKAAQENGTKVMREVNMKIRFKPNE